MRPYFDTEMPDFRYVELALAYKEQGKGNLWIKNQLAYLKGDYDAFLSEYFNFIELPGMIGENDAY